MSEFFLLNLFQVLLKQLAALDLMDKQQIVSRFEEVYKQMWVNNGNEVSKIYAGTGAIQGGSKVSLVFSFFLTTVFMQVSILSFIMEQLTHMHAHNTKILLFH